MVVMHGISRLAPTLLQGCTRGVNIVVVVAKSSKSHKEVCSSSLGRT